MRRKQWARRIAIVWLCIPVGYMAVRDVAVFAALNTNSLEPKRRLRLDFFTMPADYKRKHYMIARSLG
jgi:hypothetical protein